MHVNVHAVCNKKDHDLRLTQTTPSITSYTLEKRDYSYENSALVSCTHNRVNTIITDNEIPFKFTCIQLPNV